MELSDLESMFIYLRRTFTIQESKDLLTKFFPKQQNEIQELSMNEVKIPANDVTASTESTETTIKKKKRVSNMDRARAIYEASPDKSRKTVIRLFQEQIPGMAQATASTYYYQVSPNRPKRSPNVAKAREIYKAAPEKTRKALLPKFMELGMNENVASTYFYNCKRYFADLEAAKADETVIGAAPTKVSTNTSTGLGGSGATTISSGAAAGIGI